ncbi:MAG: S24/S26 family peptidase [Clostridia bacterium]|nr:S24/S26 family peptidase [Clostridia bacterium]
MADHEFRLDDMIGVMTEVMAGGGEFRFYPKGTSMLPLIRQGRDSIALVSAHEPLAKYDIPLYIRKNGQFVLHRVMGHDTQGYIMCGDNQTALEYGILHDQVRGKVCAIYRGDKRIDVTNRGYCLYCRIWCFMPLRKFCFLFRRVGRKLQRIFTCKK